MKVKICLAIMILLAILGIADSGYALKQHYAPPDVSSCDFNETISCTAVNQSVYSVFLGVPVAGIGIAGYLLIADLAATSMIRQSGKGLIRWLLLVLAAGALAFALWLTWIEVFTLKAVCPLCVISLSLIAAISVLALLVVLISRKEQ